MNRILAALLVLSAPAAPAAVSHYAVDGIEIDGNYVDGPDAGADWYAAFPPFRDPIRQDDETLCATSPAPKNDLTNAYVANNFEYLYVAMERLANTGNTSFFFNFDITNDGPSTGDFIFVFCFGSGEVVTDTYVLEWSAAAGSFVRDATPPSVDFAVNLVRTLAPYGALDRHGRPSSSIGAGQFGEARILLQDIEGFDVCAADNVRLEIQTKSSCSLNSQCKDTTGDIAFSFTPLTAALSVSQAAGCAPSVVATATAVSPRPGSVTYRWFLDGEEITDDDPSWATSDTITIPVPDLCGPVEISVIADDGACRVEDSAIVDVNKPPVASISAATVDACSGVLTFSGDASSDCNGSSLAFAWDFDGDGVVDSADASGVHAYAGCGDRLVRLVVSDGECESEPAEILVNVNEPPEAGLAITASGGHCLEIAYEVASTDCDLTEPSAIRTESLSTVTDFGDGGTTTDASGTHRYADCGTYIVTSTTTDASGCTSTITREVTIGVAAEVE